ncbi:hypothetical protein MPDQ_006428 [Monascus purpureus]|uniref:DUF2423 domain-containing protein n=1 Tax=Monascus purpureus TaxID=5098 RepID=A0A507QUS5_MONPU|nr:hypothetical protein MPDQ_006428 [Monascus purpureus]BDD56493.1 hypothetical protein MAP00_001942 [Monascus purpureus]
MAKSVRASVSKRNRAKLRATVFGPAVDARTERLSAKLQELASHAKEQERSSMELDITGTDRNSDSKIRNSEEDMDIDGEATKSIRNHPRRSKGIQKRNKRKSHSSIVFARRPSGPKKAPKKK